MDQIPGKICVLAIFEDKKRGDCNIYVSTCELQRQSNKGELSSNDAAKPPRYHIEHLNSHDNTIQTRTYLFVKYTPGY